MGSRVAVVGKLVATNCKANAICFGLGQLDVAEEVGVGIFLTLGIAYFETKKIVLAPSTRLEGRQDLSPPCARRKK